MNKELPLIDTLSFEEKGKMILLTNKFLSRVSKFFNPDSKFFITQMEKNDLTFYEIKALVKFLQGEILATDFFSDTYYRDVLNSVFISDYLEFIKESSGGGIIYKTIQYKMKVKAESQIEEIKKLLKESEEKPNMYYCKRCADLIS